MRLRPRRRREPQILYLDPDYGVPWPLWDKNGPIYKPQALGISEALLHEIKVWFDEWLEIPTGEPSREADEERFIREGHNLARRLSLELGSEYSVTYVE